MTADESKRIARYGWAAFAILALAYFMVYLHRTTGGALSDTFEDYYGVGTTSVALLASSYLYAYTLMQIPSGIITDRFGPRKAASVFIALIALGSVLSAVSAYADNFSLMVLGKFVIGLGAAVVFIPMVKVLALWFKRDQFATMNGVILLIGNIGAIAAATPMVLMVDLFGIGDTYMILAVITVAVACLCWLFVRDRPAERGLPEVDHEAEKKVGTMEALRTIFGGRMRFWPLALSMFFFFGTMMMWQASHAGSFYISVYGYDLHSSSIMVTLIGVGTIVGCPIGGLLSDKVIRSRKTVCLIGTGGYALAWAVMWATVGQDVASGMLFQGVLNFLFGFFSGFLVSTVAQVKEAFPASMSGLSVASLHTFTFIGGALAVATCGFVVAERTVEQYQTLCLIALVMAILAFLCEVVSVEVTPEDEAFTDPALDFLEYLTDKSE